MKNVHMPRITGLFDPPIALPFLLDEIPLGIIVLDPDRKVVLLNRAMEGLTGFVQQEVQGAPCDCILRSNICLEKCPVLSVQDASDTICMEGNIINRERQKIPIRITFARIQGIDGETAGFIEVVEDIRFLKEIDAKIGHAFGFGHLIGRSPQMERIFQILPVIAQSDSSVLITGETGTGKDFVAEAIHQASPRSRNPFIKVNCGALPETLLESELFGHQKGAFTGAVESKPGRFRLAHNGSLYLTEIGDLPLSLQVKILTFLDDKVVYPLGSSKGFNVNVRIIAATHRNLEQMVREGRFREDLLFRLNVVRLHLPPLRSRGDDVRLLLDHFLNTFISQFKKPMKGFSAKAHRILMDYSFPGNVRELRNIVEYAVNICQEDQVQPKHLPAYLTDPKLREEQSAQDERKRDALAAGLETSQGGSQGGQETLGEKETDLNWASVEKKMIMDAMIKAKGRRSTAAALLGWGRSTLWRKMKQYGIAS
jgi:PAS domain S-box-containing protein